MYEPSKLFDLLEPSALPTLKPHQKILLKAADLIRERGLAKHEQEDINGSLCIHGAISIAVHGKPYVSLYTPKELDAFQAIRVYLKVSGKDEGEVECFGLGPWNNLPHRTADEVIDALVKAAA